MNTWILVTYMYTHVSFIIELLNGLNRDRYRQNYRQTDWQTDKHADKQLCSAF